jgi:hypothetical protein
LKKSKNLEELEDEQENNNDETYLGKRTLEVNNIK